MDQHEVQLVQGHAGLPAVGQRMDLLIGGEHGIEDVDLRIGHVAPVGRGFGRLEGRIVASPQDEERRLVAAQPVLPGRVAQPLGVDRDRGRGA